jgi:glycosyltransferase involved in cell wall biosynthesis
MTIAIGAVSLDTRHLSGLNRYSTEVVRAICSERPELLLYTGAEDLARGLPGVQLRMVPGPLTRANFVGFAARTLWHQIRLPARLRSDGASLYYSTIPEGMLSPPCPQIVTIHDFIPLLFPDCHPRMKHYYGSVLPRIAAASAGIVVSSESTRRDLERFFSPADVAIHVVYPGFRADAFRPVEPAEVSRVKRAYGLGEFILTVGEMRPYKNFRRLIHAFAAVPSNTLTLVHVGGVHAREADVLELPRRLGVQNRVRFLGGVNDRDLTALYTGARAFVFPSLYEGFGIPPLEAMACGCPVIASDAASIPEVCGDAAIYVDALHEENMTAAIVDLLGDPEKQEFLREKGLERSRTFSYARAAEQLLGIMKEHGG